MPDGLGRSFNLGGGGGQGGATRVASSAPAMGGADQITATEVAQRARAQARLELLQREVPALAYSNPSMLVELASGQMEDADMMQGAFDAIGAVEVENMVTELKAMPADKQRGLAATMNPAKLSALQAAGWSIPQDKKKSFWDKAAGVLAAIDPNPAMRLGRMAGVGPEIDSASVPGGKLGAAAVSKLATLPVVKQGLAAMDWVAEESSRTQRILPMMDSGARLQQQTGLSAAELEEQTGIDTSLASAEGNAGSPAPTPLGTMNPFNVLANPGDLWNAARTWNAIGHEGDDDYLPEVQYEVFTQLEEEFGGQAKDMLRYAKALASGSSLEDLADSEGKSGSEAAVFVEQVGRLSTTAGFRKAMSRLESGRVSFGRSIARSAWNDPTKDVSEGPSRYVSGIGDAFFAVAADPTLVVGKISKSVKVARWGFRGEEGLGKLNRWQHLSRVAEMVDNGEDAAKVTEALANVPGRGFRAAAVRNHEAALLVEARAIHEPAKAVAKAFESGDFGTLVRQYPGFERSIGDMKRFDAALKAAGEEGLTKPAQVFEFYKHASGNRSVLAAVDDAAKVDVKSTKLFGHDGGGHLVVPHLTGFQRKKLATRDAFFNWRYELDPPPAALKEIADEAAAELDEAAGQLDNGMSALPEDPQFSTLDEMVVDPDTAAYVRKPLPAYKEQLNKLIEVVTSPTTKRGFVPLVDEVPTSPEEFRAFNESLGMMAGDSKVARLDRYNRFVSGNIADRHALVNQMIIDMGSATGMNMTEEGQAILRKHIEHRNHVFGVQDAITRAEGAGAPLVVRQAILEKQLADGVSVPSFRDMLIATRKTNVMRQVTGGTRRSVVEAAMTRVWKPGQILRFGFPLRAGADEALQYIGRVSAREYLNRNVLEKWAGIREASGQLARGVDGEILRAPQGAIKPVRTFTRSVATVAGVTDEALRTRAFEAAARNPEWVKASPKLREELLQPYLAEAKGNLRALPRSVRWIDDLSHQMAATSSKWFHELAISKVASRQTFAQKLLEAQGDYAKRVQSNRLFLTHEFAQQGQAEMIGGTFNGLRPGADEELWRSGLMAYDKTSPSGYQFIPTKLDGSEYSWVGHEDLGGFYNGLNTWLTHMAESPSSRAALNELTHHVPQSVIDELAPLVGEDGIAAVAAAREMTGELGPVLHAAVEWDSKTLQAYLAEIDADVVPSLALLASWDELSEKTRRFITDPYLSSSKLTTDFDLVKNRAANAIYNEFRRIDNAGNLRSLIRAQTIDGKTVAEPLKNGHTRVYGAMVDRRSAEDIVRLLSDESMAQAFAERLNQHLADRNLLSEMKAVWGAAPPSTQGYDIATWMAGMKANIAQGSGSYVPAMMAGSSNYAVAEAVRDALQDVLPEQMLKPTIGFLDHPDELFTEGFGITKLTDSTVGMAPHHAATMRAIDPDNVVRQVHVEMPDGTRMWLGESEVEAIAGKRARFERAEAKKSYSTRAMTRTKDGRIVFNDKLIKQDHADGMRFLRGEGGEFRREKAAWGWDDVDTSNAATQLDEVLESLGLQDTTGLELSDLIGLYRTRQFRSGPLPYEDVMRDNELWDDFVELAGSAKKTGTRVVDSWTDEATAQSSKIVKAALDELGVDLSGISAKDYRELLIARERAHLALGVPGQRPARTASKAAIEREADAMALALQMTRLSTDEKVLGRVRVALGKDDDFKLLGEIWGTGVTEDAAVRRASQDVLSEVLGVAVGQQSGEVLTDIVGPLLRGQHRMDNLWTKAPLADLPTRTFGPTELAAANNRWDKLLNRAFQGTAEPIIGAISRMPMMQDAFQKSLDTLRPVFDNAVHRGLDDEARALLAAKGLDPEELRVVNEILYGRLKRDAKWGDDVDDPISRYAAAASRGDAEAASEALTEATGMAVTLDDEQLDVLNRWHANQSNATEAWVHRSMTRSMEMVSPYIDDHRIRSALQEYVGPVFAPFYYAEEQFLRRFARGIYETPHMLRKGQLTMNGLRNLGVIREDAYGNEVFVIPGSDLAMGAVADVATMLTGNEAFQVMDQPLSMRTEFMIPGWSAGQSRFAWGPVVGLATEAMTRRFPETEWRTDDPNRSWWEYVVPGPAAGAYKAFLRDGDATQMASAQVAAISYLEASGHGLAPDATATEKEEYLEDVRQVARSIGVLRYITGQLTFTAATPLDNQALIRKEFTDLLAKGLSYDDAITAFLEERGPEAMVYAVFGTENQVGAPLPNNTDAAQFMFDNEALIQNNPSSAVWLIPEDKSDSKFDRRAYNQQLALGLRTRRSPAELVDAVRVKEASEEYYERRDAYEAERKVAVANGDLELRNRLDDTWKAWRDGYLAQHPAFAESFTPEASQRRQKTIEDLEWMTNAGIGGKQGEAIAPLVRNYLAFSRQYSSFSGQSSKAAKAMKEAIFNDYFDEQWAYLQDHPEAVGFWTSVIRPELPDAADDLEQAKLGAA